MHCNSPRHKRPYTPRNIYPKECHIPRILVTTAMSWDKQFHSKVPALRNVIPLDYEVVLHFSSGLVERTKRECVWKSPDVRNFYLSPPHLAFFAWGDFHMRLRFARSTIPEEKWGLLGVYYTTRAPRNLSQLWNKKFDDIRNLLLQRVTWREKGKDTRNFIP